MTPEPIVFVVDDDSDVRASVTALVKTMGAEVESFDSAERFLETYDSEQPGCLVTDVRMLGMSGLELQQRLAADGSTLPVTYAPAFDAVGAEDIDYGSADITDHTFTTDDSTFIIDGGITVSTGDNITLGVVQWNSADEIDGTKIKDADYGDIDVSAGGAWTLDTDSVADNDID